ncbi:hypothetical protein [Rhodoferax sp.]|uniref:hypothetical protein n=1 Tax=Rhodoferax sp. TaxID=50421 RepID=UPI0025FC84C0|nr:hypothetical protein [Rhodoferax sp.]
MTAAAQTYAATLAALALEVEIDIGAHADVSDTVDTAYRAIALPLLGFALEGEGMSATEVQQLHALLPTYEASRVAELSAMRCNGDATRQLAQQVRHPVPDWEVAGYCAYIARVMEAAESVHTARKAAALAAYTTARQQLAARVNKRCGLSPSEARGLLNRLQDFEQKRDAATAFEAEKTAILFHQLDPVNHHIDGNEAHPGGAAAPVPNAVDDAARRANVYSVNLLERAANFIAPCIKSPIVKKTMGKGAGAVTVCAAWPGVVAVYDPTTGALLAESEPGQPAVLRAGFTRRLH